MPNRSKIKTNNAIRQEQKRKRRRRASSPVFDDDVALPKPTRPKRVIGSLPTLSGQILKTKIETRDVNTTKRIRRNVTGSSSQSQKRRATSPVWTGWETVDRKRRRVNGDDAVRMFS